MIALAFDEPGQVLTAMFAGAMVVMAVYNLCLGLSLKERSYLWYGAFVAAFGASMVGWGTLESTPWFERFGGPAVDAVAILLCLQFSRRVLETATATPRCDRLLLSIMAVTAAAGAAVAISYDLVVLLGLTACFGASLSLLGVAMYRARRGFAPARWYLVALVVLLAGAAAEAVAEPLGVELGGLMVQQYAGGILMVVLFSLALADRYHSLLKERERIAAENEALERWSFEDALTGLANRRSFDDRLGEEWERGARESTPLSLVLIDVDHFKKFNDTYGHQEGDGCLKEVGAALASVTCRPADLAVRYGGEEFALVLPGTDLDGAREIAEAARAAVAGRGVPHESSDTADHVTISVGVATCVPDETGTPRGLVEEADAGLYAAKESGRNRVATAALAVTA